MPGPVASRLAPAKINLTLHVTGRRADGYHLLDSLVVFAELGDLVSVHDAPGLSLSLTGPQAPVLVPEADNLVLRAARMMGARDVALTLDKRLPVASGMGGGSSDAAATVKLLVARGAAMPGTAQAMDLGADLPVCLAAPQPSRMRGLGEVVDPVPMVPPLWLLLVNPGQGLSTPAVFKALENRSNPSMPDPLPRWADAASLCDWLTAQRNDLEAPAQRLMPAVSDVLAQLATQPGCLLARMTGSGATCFGVFTDPRRARAAEQALARPGWFVAVTRSEGSVS
ncbi:4-(cytidine 5'-diphospho)-2-C-methyl-D-erythritol kinase [Pararhodobacter sp.]|uniref:4-(cytidine 5'-diphospho)-2-C-methyl-D-erythritol kinase n=1 Tax=Pararhodobacter sp. TaxID=2127056 RepID=UPI002AFE0E5A|nr:4-(cytidine 5'-diphospho)-2-C-methyl-D-erythritol kinase [Pararhodobacter sp.]